MVYFFFSLLWSKWACCDFVTNLEFCIGGGWVRCWFLAPLARLWKGVLYPIRFFPFLSGQAMRDPFLETPLLKTLADQPDGDDP